MDISVQDIKVLGELVMDENATPDFEYLKECLIWPDERPDSIISQRGMECLYDLWIVRGFIHRGVPESEWGLDPEYFKNVWNFCRGVIPKWPGFMRIELSDNDRDFLQRCLSSGLSDI